MALYREGKAAMAADGTVTGTGTKWQSSLSLIRPGATIMFLSSPIQMAVVNKVVSDTEIKAITTNGAVVASTYYAILLSDSLTVDGLAQDVAETLRYYQSQETVIADAVEFFKNFDFDSLQDLANQIKQDSESAGESATAAAASETAAKTSETNAKSSENAAKTSETNAKASETAAKASETAAKTSEINAKESETAANTSETNAKASETAAKTSEINAKESETAAKTSETNAKVSETAAKTSETNAKASEVAAETARDKVQQIIDNAGDQSTLAVLAQPAGDKAIGIQQELSGSVQRTQHDKNGETLSILDFGAKANDSSFDNQYKIQAAIDAANSKYLSTGSIQAAYVPNGVFWVGKRGITNTGDSTQNGILSIQMKSGVRLYGEGTIKAKANAYGSGAYYRMIGSDRGDRVQDVEIIGITLDGNASNQVASTQCSNMVLEASRNILIDGVKSVNSNGNGMMIRGRYPDAVHNVRIVNCYVYNCSFIGIQSSQFNGLVISDNTVDTTGDNGIDIYGDTGISRTDSNGVNFSITGNTVKNSKCGIFPETVAHGTISANSIYNCATGIHINRIYSTPRNIIVTGNSLSKSTNSGITVSGDMEGVTICGNNFSDWTGSAIRLGNSDGQVSGVYINSNTFIPSDTASYVLKVVGVLASRIEVRNNTVRNTIGLTMDFVYSNTAETSAGVNVDSWAFASGTIESTGLQMYRSGTFKPTIEGFTTAGTTEYVHQYGHYLRIGDVVYYSLNVSYTGATGVGPVLITGLPFIPKKSVLQPESVAHSSMLTTSATETLWVLPNARGLSPRIKTMGSNDGPTYLRMDGVNYVAGEITVSGFYYV